MNFDKKKKNYSLNTEKNNSSLSFENYFGVIDILAHDASIK